MPTIQTVVSDELHARLERLAQTRDLSISALTRDVLESATKTAGTFFGVVMCRSNAEASSDQWFAIALDGPEADVVDGSLIVRNHAGLAQVIVAPGRWRECSRRIEADRAVFNTAENLKRPTQTARKEE